MLSLCTFTGHSLISMEEAVGAAYEDLGDGDINEIISINATSTEHGGHSFCVTAWMSVEENK